MSGELEGASSTGSLALRSVLAWQSAENPTPSATKSSLAQVESRRPRLYPESDDRPVPQYCSASITYHHPSLCLLCSPPHSSLPSCCVLLPASRNSHILPLGDSTAHVGFASLPAWPAESSQVSLSAKRNAPKHAAPDQPSPKPRRRLSTSWAITSQPTAARKSMNPQDVRQDGRSSPVSLYLRQSPAWKHQVALRSHPRMPTCCSRLDHSIP